MRAPHRQTRRISAAVAAVVALALAACSTTAGTASITGGSSAPTTGTASTTESVLTPPPSTSEPAADGTLLTIADLQRLGVTVVPDEAVIPADAGAYVVTTTQAQRMVAEADNHTGLLGADLDQLAPMPAGAPPFSYLLAAWAATGTSAQATIAKTLLGEQDWSTAPSLVFPTAVVALFVTDLAALLTAVPDDPDGASATASETVRSDQAPASFSDAPSTSCGQATQFLANAVKHVFDALKLTAKPSGGVLGSIVAAVNTVWNFAVDIAKGIVDAVYQQLTAPVFAALQIAAAAAGAATMLSNYLSGQRLTVSLAAAKTYPFAIGSAADVTGEWIARVIALSDKWPSSLLACIADAGGGELPTPMAPGSKATWTLVDDPLYPGTITLGRTDEPVRDDRSARLGFTTGRESDEQARGPNTASLPIVTVEVEQRGVADFLKKARENITSKLTDSILSFIPVPSVRDVVAAQLQQVLAPALNRLDAEIAGLTNGVYTLKGQSSVVVTFHLPPEPTPTPTPSENGSDFCDQFLAMVIWSRDNLPNGNSWTSWGAELARRLHAMQPAAPAEYQSDVEVMAHIYDLVAAGTNFGVLGAAVADTDFPGAAQRLTTYCQIDPGLFPGFGQ